MRANVEFRSVINPKKIVDFLNRLCEVDSSSIQGFWEPHMSCGWYFGSFLKCQKDKIGLPIVGLSDIINNLLKESDKNIRIEYDESSRIFKIKELSTTARV